MGLFKKRETLIQNIAYMALMAAINVIFVLLTAILPPLMFLIIFVLPLTSTIVTLFCKKKYFLIYFVVTIALCLIVTSGIYIYDTFFYVIPSMISGFAFGFLIEKNVPSIYIILITSIIQYLLTFLTFIILDAILPELNFIDALLRIFGLAEFEFKAEFVHIFLYSLSFIQIVFTYVITKNEVKKLGFEINLNIESELVLVIVSFSVSLFALMFVFVYLPLTFVLVALNIPVMLYQIVELLFKKRKLYYVLLGVAFIISAIIFVAS